MTTNNSRGYSLRLVRQIEAANPMHIGVQLGKICVAQEIPAIEVARAIGVSKQAVYSWFTGRFHPRPLQTEKLEALLAKYKAGTAV